MSRPAIIAGILAVVGTLALAAFLGRRTPQPASPVSDDVSLSILDQKPAATFEIVPIQDRFSERTAPKDDPDPGSEDPVAVFPEAKESDH
jgi:hypothetical protein